MPIAFKEWAVTVRALAEGEQLVTLRKGGIREEEKHFEVEYDRFFLYPTFDHQRNDLVRESHHPELRRALEEGVWPDEEPPPRALLQDGGIAQPDRVRIRSWAEVTDHFETSDPRIVDSLSPFHVWTQDYAHKRLRWKRRHPDPRHLRRGRAGPGLARRRTKRAIDARAGVRVSGMARLWLVLLAAMT